MVNYRLSLKYEPLSIIDSLLMNYSTGLTLIMANTGADTGVFPRGGPNFNFSGDKKLFSDIVNIKKKGLNYI